mgnify:CR=1 FL=1
MIELQGRRTRRWGPWGSACALHISHQEVKFLTYKVSLRAEKSFIETSIDPVLGERFCRWIRGLYVVRPLIALPHAPNFPPVTERWRLILICL